MSQPISVVDAFAVGSFTGNPAAVCILEDESDPKWMQQVAAEMNLAETAFLLKQKNHYHLRWFTPKLEVDLCGHATLAAAHVLWTEGHLSPTEMASFQTRSGELTAVNDQGKITLDFPVAHAIQTRAPGRLLEALGLAEAPIYVGKSFDYLVHVSSADIVRSLTPNFLALGEIETRGIIVTAQGDSGKYDIVSRFFAPAVGINEDPVTGSAHCILASYWSMILQKNTLRAFQASSRGGELLVELKGDRVMLSGKAFTTLRGVLTV